MIVPLSVTSETGKRVAVLTPKEKNLIWEQLNPTYRIRGDLLLYTCMRIAEARHFVKHPEYFRKDNCAIFFPIVPGLGKDRCILKQRTITLSTNGVHSVEEFFEHKVGIAAYQNMEAAFILAAKKADFDTSFITTKMLRKTGVSWYLSAYPTQQSQIAQMAGHDIKTMNTHYLAYGWRKEDKKDMAEELKGWGGDMIVPTGGYFQIGRDNDFPWWSTDRMTWYFTVDKNGDMKGYTPSKTNKKFLTTHLEENPSISLFGVWTGKYSTSIFVFDSKVAIEKLKGES